jgi:hypothetical protein
LVYHKEIPMINSATMDKITFHICLDEYDFFDFKFYNSGLMMKYNNFCGVSFIYA